MRRVSAWLSAVAMALLAMVVMQVRGLRHMMDDRVADVFGIGQTIEHESGDGSPVRTERLFSAARWPETDGIEPLASWLARHQEALRSGDLPAEEQ